MARFVERPSRSYHRPISGYHRGWDAISFINTYAMFIGHLSLGVRGLSLLVIMWITVVLLGGFVTLLEKKDFWCLAVITLVQTAGVFDVFLGEKMGSIWNAFIGLLVPSIIGKKEPSRSLFQASNVDTIEMLVRIATEAFSSSKAAIVTAAVQVVMFAIILLPLAALYMLGIYISTGLSLWRLIQRDYGVTGADPNKANLKPALVLLYSLCLFQGVLFCYKKITIAFAEKKISNGVSKLCSFSDEALILDYLCETRTGCESDPLFIRGRNMITYAVDLMESKSPDSYISGIKLMDSLVQQQYLDLDTRTDRDSLLECHMLMKQLLAGSPSSSYITHKLLNTLDSRSPYDREIRECAARIVAHIAGDIHLERFPGGIQCIASLLCTFDEYCFIQPFQRDWLLEIHEPEGCLQLRKTYDEVWEDAPPPKLLSANDIHWQNHGRLVLDGMCILRKLAGKDDNCKVISNTPGLVSKIMAPLHIVHHDGYLPWHEMVEGSLRVLSQLVTAYGETGTNLCYSISSDKQAITSMQNIININCPKCHPTQAIKVLTHLCMDDASSNLATEIRQIREDFIKKLVKKIFEDQPGYPTKLAGEKLVMLSSQSKSNAMVILQASDDRLFILLENTESKYENTLQINAAEILENLCRHSNRDDECLRKLKEAMPGALLKVLSSPQQYNGEQHKDGKLQAALLSLCVTVCDTLVSADEDLIPVVAPRDGASSFAKKLMEMVERNNEFTADCLEVLKVTSKMVISMMKHRDRYVHVQQDLKNLIRALSIASKKKLDLDYCSMVFASDNHGATTTKPIRTLSSLVKEARELVDKKLEL